LLDGEAKQDWVVLKKRGGGHLSRREKGELEDGREERTFLKMRERVVGRWKRGDGRRRLIFYISVHSLLLLLRKLNTHTSQGKRHLDVKAAVKQH
jgi:hypothetical protein